MRNEDISENMILTEDMQRMGENNPRIVENDMSKVSQLIPLSREINKQSPL